VRHSYHHEVKNLFLENPDVLDRLSSSGVEVEIESMKTITGR
jgi:hypothetical protein